MANEAAAPAVPHAVPADTKAAEPVTAAPAAADPHATGTAVGHDAGAKKVFPPLDPATMGPQLVWLAITLTALYLLLSRMVLPRIGGIIEERKTRIQRDIEAANRLKGDTDKALQTYEKALADARGNASTIARDTRDRLTAETDKERAAIEAQNAKNLAAAEARIAANKQKALASVGEIASDTASAIVKQLIGQDVSADDIRSALKPVAGE